MAEQYKIIHPIKYYRDYLNNDIRPDGREFDKFRPIAINIGSITTTDGSAIVKIGNTTVVCGIRAELSKPKAIEPDKGYLVPNIELLPICSQNYRSAGGGSGGGGGAGTGSYGQSIVEDSEMYTSILNDILINSNCIDLKDLCITKEKLVWTLYCDISCLDHDGCVVDGALIACIAALKHLTLPKIEHDIDIDKITVDNSKRSKLNIKSTPISTTLIVFDDNIILTDPTKAEEELSSSIVTIAISNSKVCFVLKPGGIPFNSEQMSKCVEQALSNEKRVLKLLNDVLKS